MLARQAYSPTAPNTESGPFEDPSETEEPQPLSPMSASSSPDYTPAIPHIDDETESIKSFETRPTLSAGYSAKLTEAMTLSPSSFRKSTESEDEDTDSKDEETAPEGQQQHVILVEDKAEDEPFGLGYRAARRRAFEQTRYIVPSTYEVGQGSGSTPNQQLETTGETPIQTNTRLPIHTTWEDLEDSTIYRNIECDIPLVRLLVRASPCAITIVLTSNHTLSPSFTLVSWCA
uniref:Uncharacterized protein n=1 Tax=Tanacetum cinerariifolium TaxID=118510 RepID=A0A699HY98_TANCI|nr:hypothetical protein [Tanacetum cinerariifolium]